MVDGNLEIHYHLLQKILRLSHIDIKQMLLILPVQSCSCISDSIQTVPEGKQSTVVRKEVSLWLHRPNLSDKGERVTSPGKEKNL